LRKEAVESAKLDIEPGTVKEETSMKTLGAFLERDSEIYEWWRTHMGYKKDEEAP
jgi:hypothetical protein